MQGRTLNGQKTPESSMALEARLAPIKLMRAYSQMKSPKLIIEIIQPLPKRETEPERVMQTLDGQSHQKGTVSPVS